jgi:hypothetical protein
VAGGLQRLTEGTPDASAGRRTTLGHGMHWAVIVSVSGVGRKRGAGAEAEARAHSTCSQVQCWAMAMAMGCVYGLCKYKAFIRARSLLKSSRPVVVLYMLHACVRHTCSLES